MTYRSRMKSIRSFAKIPRELRVEKPNRLRMNKNSPRRFLDRALSDQDDKTSGDHALEAGNVVRHLVKEKPADESHDDRNSIVCSHQQRISDPQSATKSYPISSYSPVQVLERPPAEQLELRPIASLLIPSQ